MVDFAATVVDSSSARIWATNRLWISFLVIQAVYVDSRQRVKPIFLLCCFFCVVVS
jgi:hypothetical protein